MNRQWLGRLSGRFDGLRILPPDWRSAATTTALAIAGVTLFIVVLDALIFRDTLPSVYVEKYTSPLFPRTLLACAMSGWEEIKFRLLLMSGLAMLASACLGRLTPLHWTAIILLAQFVNVGAIVIAYPVYGTLRFWAVGSVWGWLYWRHGWLSALAGHSAAHIVLDPALKFALLATG